MLNKTTDLKTTTKYVVKDTYDIFIWTMEVTRETENGYYIKNKYDAFERFCQKNVSDQRWFDTFQEAKTHAVTLCDREVNRLSTSLTLGKVKRNFLMELKEEDLNDE